MCFRKTCCFRCAVLIALISPPVQAGTPAPEPAPGQVWLFTAQQLPPIRHTDRADRLFVLGDVDQSLKALSFANPGNQVQAKQRAMAVIQSTQGQAMIARMRGSVEAIAVAWQHGIEKLPAVLVDECYVVYGVYNVETALQQIERARDAQ